MPYGIDLRVSMRSSIGKQASIVVLQASPLLTSSSFSTMISNASPCYQNQLSLSIEQYLVSSQQAQHSSHPKNLIALASETVHWCCSQITRGVLCGRIRGLLLLYCSKNHYVHHFSGLSDYSMNVDVNHDHL